MSIRKIALATFALLGSFIMQAQPVPGTDENMREVVYLYIIQARISLKTRKENKFIRVNT